MTMTSRTDIVPPDMLGDRFEPTRFDTFEASFSFDKLLPAHVDWSDIVMQGYSPTAADEKDTYQEHEKQEEEG